MIFNRIPGTIKQIVAHIIYVMGIMYGASTNVRNEITSPKKPEITINFVFKINPEIETPIDTIINSINGITLNNILILLFRQQRILIIIGIEIQNNPQIIQTYFNILSM